MLKILAAAAIGLSALTFAATAGAAGYGNGSSSSSSMNNAAPPMHMQSPGFMQKAPAHRIRTNKGTVLADWRGYALYTFGKDPRGVSTCYGKCAVAWPPFRAPMGSKAFGPWSIVHRAMFGNQWAYNGKPLYFWFKDARPGQVTGDGVNGFHVAR